MKIVIRTYAGKIGKQHFEVMEKHHAEVQQLMGSIEGLISYTLARNSLGGFSVTVCKSQSGINKSIKAKQSFIAQHASEMNLAAMQVIEGEIITHLNKGAA